MVLSLRYINEFNFARDSQRIDACLKNILAAKKEEEIGWFHATKKQDSIKHLVYGMEPALGGVHLFVLSKIMSKYAHFERSYDRSPANGSD